MDRCFQRGKGEGTPSFSLLRGGKKGKSAQLFEKRGGEGSYYLAWKKRCAQFSMVVMGTGEKGIQFRAWRKGGGELARQSHPNEGGGEHGKGKRGGETCRFSSG